MLCSRILVSSAATAPSPSSAASPWNSGGCCSSVGGGLASPFLFPVPHPAASGICHASQTVGLFRTVQPEVHIRDAQPADCWEVADTHCSSFYPDYTFPLDLFLRIDRYVALLSSFSVPPGCMRACLVAVNPSSAGEYFCIRCGDLKLMGFEEMLKFSRGSISGILTVDTDAEFLPRRGPFRQRRTGIAYIGNVAVREAERRKGIAKMLVEEAEERAREWGCRSVALHCDANNIAALRLYQGKGYKCIRVPDGARWPQPKAPNGVQFHLMMKLLPRRKQQQHQPV